MEQNEIERLKEVRVKRNNESKQSISISKKKQWNKKNEVKVKGKEEQKWAEVRKYNEMNQVKINRIKSSEIGKRTAERKKKDLSKDLSFFLGALNFEVCDEKISFKK